MNLLRFFTQDEQIAGLAISEEAVRLIFLRQDRETQETLIEAKEEEFLPSGTISDGIVKNEDALVAALKTLLARTKIDLKYFTVSIPGDQAYCKVFMFPKSITDEKLREAMELATSFQLPFSKENVYLDWEKAATPDKKEDEFSVALTALNKTIVEGYLSCLKKAGIKVVALEIHPLSTLRISEPTEEAVLITEESASGTLLFIAKNGIIRFFRMLPRTFLNDTQRKTEIEKVRNFYETEHEAITTTVSHGETSWKKEFLSYNTEIDDRAKWIAALGVAVRASIGRSKDTFMSLMPVGTEKAYEYQRAAAFSNLITNVSVGLSLFFALSFFASYALMLTIQGNFSRQISGLGAVAVPDDTASIEQRIQNLNTLIAETSTITKTFPRFSTFIEELTAKTTGGIITNNITISSAEGRISMSGTAKDRATLNAFRNTLREWNEIKDLDFPTTNLELNEDIPFQTAFSLSDPQSLYNWK